MAASNRIIIELLGRNSLSGPVNQGVKSLLNLEKVAGSAKNALAAIGIGIGAAELVKGTTKIVADLQDFQSRLGALTTSTAGLGKEQQYVAKTAQRMGIDLNTARDSYSKFLTLVQSGLLSQQQARLVFEGMANAQRMFGVSQDQIGFVIYGLTQALSQATIQAQELNQVVEPMPGFLERLGKAAGMTGSEFRKMVLDQKITGTTFKNVVLKTFQGMTGVAEKAVNNINPSLNNLRTAWTLFIEDFEKPIGNVVKTSLDAIDNALKTIKQDIQSGFSLGVLRAEIELWQQAMTNAAGKTIADFEAVRTIIGVSGLSLEELLTKIREGFTDFPANFKAGLTIVFGEVDKLQASLITAFKIIGTYGSSFLDALIIDFKLMAVNVGSIFDGLLDSIYTKFANGLTKIARGLEKLPSSIISPESIDAIRDIAEAFKKGATFAEDTKARIKSLNEEYAKLPETLKANLKALEDKRKAAVDVADEAIRSALEERDAQLKARDATVKALNDKRKAQQDATKEIKDLAEQQRELYKEFLKKPLDPNTTEARKKIDELQKKIDELKKGAKVPIEIIQKGNFPAGTNPAAGQFATGGRIPGFGGGDRVHIMAEPGEYVINKWSSRRYAGLLDALNRDQLPANALPGKGPGYQTGGQVMDEVTINLNIGGKRHQVRSSRQTARDLADALTDLSKALPA